MKGEKQQRREGRLSGQKDTELLYLEEAACVEGRIHQANLLFIILGCWALGQGSYFRQRS